MHGNMGSNIASVEGLNVINDPKCNNIVITTCRDRAVSFRVGGAKEECLKENFFFGPGGACLWISIQFL